MGNSIIRKFAPTAGVFALTVWCGWQFLEDASPLDDLAQQSPTRIDSDAFEPKLPVRIDRDMFAVVATAKPQQQERVLEQAEAAPPPFDPAPMLANLRLKGTFVHGERRVALINGGVFDEGETVTQDRTSGVRCQLRRVYADAVVVEVDGLRYRLAYGGRPERLTAVSMVPSTTPANERTQSRGPCAALVRAFANSLSNNSPAPKTLPYSWSSIRDLARPLWRPSP